MALPTKKSLFGALDGIKVIYSVAKTAAPTAMIIMAEWGTDVIWIENIWTGDSMCNTTWVKEMERRNIYSISTNPFTEDGKEAPYAIVKNADASIESGKGPMYVRKGITDEFLWEINPKLVIVRVSGFGQWGDEEQINSAAYNPTVATYAGIVAQNGNVDQPMNISPYLGDYINSLMIIPSALVVLHRVGVIGEGESIDMAVHETLLWVGTYYMTDYTNTDILYSCPGTRHQNLCSIDIYECKGGFIGLCLYGVLQNKYLFETVGLGHLWGTEEYPEGTSALWLNGPRANLIQGVLEEHLRVQSKFDVQRDFVTHHIAAQAVSEFSNILTVNHIKAHGCFIDPEKADDAPVKVLNALLKFRRNPGAFWRPTLALDEDTRDVLKRAGYSDEDIDRLVKSGIAKVEDEN